MEPQSATMVLGALILIISINAVIFFKLGIRKERERWNYLINDGTIPKPGMKIKKLIESGDLTEDQLKEAIKLLKQINPELAKTI
jgi:hypothetical protein